MLRNFLKILLRKLGKSYALDERIPTKKIIRLLYDRFFMLARGVLLYKKNIFLGKGSTIYNHNNLIVGKACTLDRAVELDCYAETKVVFGNNVKIGAYSIISITSHLSLLGKGLIIGDNSAFSEFCYFGCAGGIQIGSDVIAGQYVSFHSQNHIFSNSDMNIREQGVHSSGIEIGSNIWIGSKVTFLDGSKVSDNSVVAAGAVVSDEFPPNVVIGGVPARVIKKIQ